MNMVQCSKVVTGHRYDIGLLKGQARIQDSEGGFRTGI